MKTFNFIYQFVSVVYWILYVRFAALLRFEVDIVVICTIYNVCIELKLYQNLTSHILNLYAFLLLLHIM